MGEAVNATGANEQASVHWRDGWREHRPTPSQRLHEVTMAALARRPAEPEHSVTISRNAKGVVQFEVTVRGFDPGDCLSEAERITDHLTATYPYPSENGDG